MILPMPQSATLTTLLLFIILCVITLATTEVINPNTTISCHVRQYNMRVSKPHTMEDGEIIPCEGVVPVHSCWGRCDSSEIGDYKLPFKRSHHPVCTYTGIMPRTVQLDCPGHPDPEVEVFDAQDCACSLCNPEYTSCENLNG